MSSSEAASETRDEAKWSLQDGAALEVAYLKTDSFRRCL